MHWIDRIVGPFTTLELLLLGVILLLAVLAPALGRQWFVGIERSRIANASPTQHMLAAGLLAIALRAAFLPWLGPPVPIAHDEHSLMLQAQTFLAGRLANPAPAFWQHFESIHINVLPTYASMYFPGRSLPLLLGLLLGHAWIGVWMSFVLMCAAAVWMLQAWVPARFALLGGCIVAVKLGVFSYWVNSYWGGALTATGGMLVLGAVPRLLDRPRFRDGVWLGLGALILVTTRPYEGALLCAPVGLFLKAEMLRRRGFPIGRLLLKGAVPAILLAGVGVGTVLVYNAATTGEALITPYDLNRQTYAITPAFLIAERVESARSGPAYFREFYRWEDIPYARRNAPSQMVRGFGAKIYYIGNFYVGLLLAPAFLAGLWATRRDYVLPGTLLFFLAGYALVTWNFPHYAAPLFPVLLIITMKGFVYLREWRWRGREAGLFVTRATPLALLLTLLLPAATVTTGWPPMVSNQSSKPCCALVQSTIRSRVADQLENIQGRDLVLVAPDANHPTHEAILYNDPDIAASDIVWAHRLGDEQDARLLASFPGRHVWHLVWRPGVEPGYQVTRAASRRER